MNRILRSTETAPFFGATTPRFLDPEDAARLEATVAAAYKRGFTEGERAGRVDADHAARLIDRALHDAADRATELRDTMVGDALELGLAVADAALGESRFLSLPMLAERITAAIDRLDDSGLTVLVAAEDLEPLQEIMTPPPGVDIRTDRSIGPGEAQIVGGWSATEITKVAALTVAREALS